MQWSGETEAQMYQRWETGVRWFALFPTQMESGRWVWLEYYWGRFEGNRYNGGYWTNYLTEEELDLCLWEEKERLGNRPPPPNGHKRRSSCAGESKEPK
jgi:hypothetical protein